jgi:hypothetical protein
MKLIQIDLRFGKLLNRISTVQECDARMFNSSNAAKDKKIIVGNATK